MVRQTGDSLIATLVEGLFIARNNLHIIVPDNSNMKLEFLLGLINSKFLDFIYTFMNPEKGEALAEVKKIHVERLPIPNIDFTNPKEVEQHDRMVSMVERMLDLHKREPQTPQEAERIQREIAVTDAAIDQLVYELYGLTEEEIEIVEAGS
jgi:hypothetical protein